MTNRFWYRLSYYTNLASAIFWLLLGWHAHNVHLLYLSVLFCCFSFGCFFLTLFLGEPR